MKVNMEEESFFNEWEELKYPTKRKLGTYFVAHHTIEGIYKIAPVFLLLMVVQYSYQYETFQWMQMQMISSLEYVNAVVDQLFKITWEMFIS